MDNLTYAVNVVKAHLAAVFKHLAEYVTAAYETYTDMTEATRDKHAPPVYVALTRPRPHRVRVRDKVLDRRPVVSHRLNH